MVAIWFYFETCAATLQKLTRRAVAQMKKKGLELTMILCIVPLYIFVNRTASNDTQLYKLNFTMATPLKGVWDAPLVNQYVTDSVGIFARSKDAGNR